MAESVTLGFMLSAFVRQSDGFQKRLINMVNFCSKREVLFVCMCV